ncbi:MAG: pyridoxal phosphate-dependent aminotransferase [Alkalispirochaeta sp.]
MAEIRPSLRGLHFSPTLLINEEVARLRAEGREVYHMGFGESPFPVHPIIQERIGGYAGRNQYLPAAGLASLRKQAQRYIIDRHGIENEDFIPVIGPGSKELIFDIQLAVEGDLLFPVPSWVSYIPQTLITRDEVVKIRLGPERAYKLDGPTLDEAIRTARDHGRNPRKLILNYPNNPTGMSYTDTELAQIADVCRDNDILVISDEIYARVSFGAYHHSIARYYPEGTIVTTGLSKHLSLGGFRLGVALVPAGMERIFEVIRAIASETFSAVSTPIQYAVMAAFEEYPEIEGYIQQCTTIHRSMTMRLWMVLQRLGLDYGEPSGAFYLYPDFEPYRERFHEWYGVSTSADLAARILERESVATLPGSAFGEEPDRLRLRLSTVDFNGARALEAARSGEWQENDEFYARTFPRSHEALVRLERFCTDPGGDR